MISDHAFFNRGAGCRYRVWLGQSARTTIVTESYPELQKAHWMASLGDAVHRPRMLRTVFTPGLRNRLSITGPLMLDSGGFTIMMRNAHLTAREVAAAFRAVEADVLVSLDHPPLYSDAPDVRLRKHQRTLENLQYLSEQIDHRRLAPVVHGISLEEVEESCTAVRTVLPDPRWVCLGGLVPLLRRSGRRDDKAAAARQTLRVTIRLLRRAFPTSMLHILGVGSPRTISIAFASGANSVDSIGWRRAAGFGTIFLPGGTERFVAGRSRKRAKSRKLLDEYDLEVLSCCECPACERAGNLAGRVSSLGNSYLARAAHNAWVLVAVEDRPG